MAELDNSPIFLIAFALLVALYRAIVYRDYGPAITDDDWWW